VAFAVGPVTDPALSSVELLREPLYLYAPAQDSGDIHTARWVLYPEGSRTRAIIDAALAGLGIVPSVALESSNPAVLRQMVSLGLGWSVLPPMIAEGPAGAAGVRRGEHLTERPLHAARRRDSPPDPRAEAFLALAIEHGHRIE
jgi:DNA-binding transcriptional LysR family regulator